MGNIIGNCYHTGRGTSLLVMLLLCVLSAEAQETAGEGAAQVIAIAGEVMATRVTGEEVMLQRRAAIYPGDIVTTAPQAWVQLRFADRALLSLMCNSSLQVKGYQYQDRNSDHSELHLRYGRMRTVTGVIQRRNTRSTTALAEVTVSGTDYEVAAINPAVHYFGVYDGSIRISTRNGSLSLDAISLISFARFAEGEEPVALAQVPASLGIGVLEGTNCN